MSFFSSLKKIIPYVSPAATIAVEAETNPIGAALSVVSLIEQKGGSTGDQIKAVATAVDDHQGDIVGLISQIKAIAQDVAELQAAFKASHPQPSVPAKS